MHSLTTPIDGAPPWAPTIWFRAPRRTLDGVGIARIIDVPAPWTEHLLDAATQLCEIEVINDVGLAGTGPVAFASMPFDPQASGRLLVPRRVWGSTPDGDRWMTVIGDEPPSPDDVAPAIWPSRIHMSSPIAPTDWALKVELATKRIAAGDIDKVVLAREFLIEADSDWPVSALGERLATMHPHSFRFCVDGHVGASPELLVSRIGDVVRSQPMAGTTRRSGDAAEDHRLAAALLASAKNREEHQITINAVHAALLGWCSYLDAEPDPRVVAAGSVQHLATLVEGRLTRPSPSVLELVTALHPTPAVGGRPTEAALTAIADLEGFDRRRYAGPVGWVDATGNGTWAVGLRGVEVDGPLARIRVGTGLVGDSDPETELEETRAKLAATIGALTRL